MMANIISFWDSGKKPSFSPASTAGRVRIMRLTSRALKAFTAMATARYVLPVPAGPTPKVTAFLTMAPIYAFWPNVFGRTGRPLAVMAIKSPVRSFTRASSPLPASEMQ